MVNPATRANLDGDGRWPITRAGWETLVSYRMSEEPMHRLWGYPPPDIARRLGWRPTRIEAARGQAMAAWAGERAPGTAASPARFLVLGDPQAPLHRLFEHLDHQELLNDDGWLRPDCGLVCVGDYFDFAADDPEAAGYEGVQFLSWLAAHPSSQVILLLGNHDAERVGSLSGCSLDAYRAAQAAYPALVACATRIKRRVFLEAWSAAHPRHPPIAAAHGFRAYVPAQGVLVRQLLEAGRIRMAATGVDDQGRTVLITHAGVTNREYDLLGCPADAIAWAHALQAFLTMAIDRVRSIWRMQLPERLDLAPLYTGWEHLRPNGGTLIHRPDMRPDVSNPQDDLGLDPPIAPRAADPAAFLLAGLHQVVGHTVAARRLVPWLVPRVCGQAATAPPGRLLWLRPDGDSWILDQRSPLELTCSLTCVDISLATTEPTQVECLWLRSLMA